MKFCFISWRDVGWGVLSICRVEVGVFYHLSWWGYKLFIYKTYIFIIYMYKEDLALYNQYRLICHKTQPTSQTTNYNFSFQSQYLYIWTEFNRMIFQISNCHHTGASTGERVGGISLSSSSFHYGMEVLRKTFPGHFISLSGVISRSTHSSDLSLSDYFLWGYLKDQAVEQVLQTSDKQKDFSCETEISGAKARWTLQNIKMWF